MISDAGIFFFHRYFSVCKTLRGASFSHLPVPTFLLPMRFHDDVLPHKEI